jgi:hypothetical protein
MIQILNITGSYQLPDNVNDCDNAARFDYIYDTGLWGVGQIMKASQVAEVQ